MDNVLITDGDAQFLGTLKDGLNRLRQFNVHVASDMPSVIDALSTHRIAVLVTGLDNGAFDPLALLSHMSRNHPITPCIVMTDRGKPWFRSRLGQQSFLYYQEKPFELGMLASSVIVGLNLCDLGTNIEGMTLASLLPIMAMLGRSCRLAVATDDRQAGEMLFRDGVLFDARCNGQEGEAAARRMASWNRIAFDIFDLPDNPPRRIETDLMEIADATWNREAAAPMAGAPHCAPEDEILVLEDVVSGDGGEEGEEEEPEAILLEEEVPPEPVSADRAERESAQTLLKKLLLDIRPVKGYQAAAIVNAAGQILAEDQHAEFADLELMAAELPRFCGEAQAAADRMRLDTADAATLHTRSGTVVVQNFLSETGIPLCALIVCSPRGNWYYFKVRLDTLARVAASAN